MSDPDAEANALAIAALMQADADEETAAAAAAAAAGFSDDNDDGEESGEDVYIPDILWDEYKAREYWMTELEEQFEQETKGLGKLAGSEHPFDLVVSALRTHISNIMNVDDSDEKGVSRRTQFLLEGDHLAALVSAFEGTAQDINASRAEFLGDRSDMYTFCSDVDSMTKHQPSYLYPARAQEIKERVLALARFSEAELTKPNGYEPRTADDMTGESIKSLEASLKHLLTGPEKGFMWKEQF